MMFLLDPTGQAIGFKRSGDACVRRFVPGGET